MDTGHRLLDICSWEGGPFPIPDRLAKEFDLSPGAFNLDRAHSAYESSGSGNRGSASGYLSNLLENGDGSFLFPIRSHEYPAVLELLGLC